MYDPFPIQFGYTAQTKLEEQHQRELKPFINDLASAINLTLSPRFGIETEERDNKLIATFHSTTPGIAKVILKKVRTNAPSLDRVFGWRGLNSGFELQIELGYIRELCENLVIAHRETTTVEDPPVQKTTVRERSLQPVIDELRKVIIQTMAPEGEVKIFEDGGSLTAEFVSKLPFIVDTILRGVPIEATNLNSFVFNWQVEVIQARFCMTIAFSHVRDLVDTLIVVHHKMMSPFIPDHVPVFDTIPSEKVSLLTKALTKTLMAQDLKTKLNAHSELVVEFWTTVPLVVEELLRKAIRSPTLIGKVCWDRPVGNSFKLEITAKYREDVAVTLAEILVIEHAKAYPPVVIPAIVKGDDPLQIVNRFVATVNSRPRLHVEMYDFDPGTQILDVTIKVDQHGWSTIFNALTAVMDRQSNASLEQLSASCHLFPEKFSIRLSTKMLVLLTAALYELEDHRADDSWSKERY